MTLFQSVGFGGEAKELVHMGLSKGCVAPSCACVGRVLEVRKAFAAHATLHRGRRQFTTNTSPIASTSTYYLCTSTDFPHPGKIVCILNHLPKDPILPFSYCGIVRTWARPCAVRYRVQYRSSLERLRWGHRHGGAHPEAQMGLANQTTHLNLHSHAHAWTSSTASTAIGTYVCTLDR